MFAFEDRRTTTGPYWDITRLLAGSTAPAFVNLMSSDVENAEGNGIHTVELCVYSLLSTDLDGIYQSINQLRESQALLLLLMRKCRGSLKLENEVLYDKSSFDDSSHKLNELEKRMNKLIKRMNEIKSRSEKLAKQH